VLGISASDLTIFTTLFGGAESLDNFWYNLATKRMSHKSKDLLST